MKECLENRVKMSRRKLKRRGETDSPNAKRQRCTLPKDQLLQRLVSRFGVSTHVHICLHAYLGIL